MAELQQILGKPLTGDLLGLARVIEAATLVVAAEVAASRDAAALRRKGEAWRALMDAGVVALGDAIAAIAEGGPAAFWADAEALANTMTAEAAARLGGTC